MRGWKNENGKILFAVDGGRRTTIIVRLHNDAAARSGECRRSGEHTAADVSRLSYLRSWFEGKGRKIDEVGEVNLAAAFLFSAASWALIFFAYLA